MKSKRILIIGGGISGLSTAYFLQELSREKNLSLSITLLEGSPRFGGIIATEKTKGFLMEHGPDMFLAEKPLVREVCRKLGLEDQLLSTNEGHRRSFVYSGGRLHPVPQGFYLIAPSNWSTLFDLGWVSAAGKMRMAMEPLIFSRSDGDESIAAFVRRRFGKEAYEKVGQPMFGGIYSGDPEKLSLKATMPRFIDMEREVGGVTGALAKKARQAPEAICASGPRYSLFLSFREGMESLTEGMMRHLSGVRCLANAPVRKIEFNGGWTVEIENGSRFEADLLCLALTGAQAGPLLAPVAPEAARELAMIPYESAAVVHMAIPKKNIGRAFDGFGFVVPDTEGKKIIGCTFSSVKFEGRAPEDSVLLRAFLGGAFHPEVDTMTDEALVSVVQQELSEILSLHVKPLFTSVKRHKKAMPQYHIGHLDRVERIRNRIRKCPGLFLTSNAFHGVGIPDCMLQAKKMAEDIGLWITSY